VFGPGLTAGAAGTVPTDKALKERAHRRAMGQQWVMLLVGVPMALAGCIGGEDGGNGGGGAPVAAFTTTPGADGRTFTFDARASKGSDLTYAWSFGDGSTGTGRRVDHTYELTNALLGVTLTVADAAGRLASVVQGVQLGEAENRPPTVALTLSTDWAATSRPFRAEARSSDPDGDAVTLRVGTAYLGQSAPAALLPAGGDGHAHDHGSGSAYTPDANGFDSPMMAPGVAYNVTLTAPGVYDYHCHPHPWMTGVVVVADEPGALEGTVTLAAWNVKTFLPQTVIVKPGTRLVWDNPDPAPHTVTLSRQVPLTAFAAVSDGSATLQFDREGVYVVTALATDAKGASAIAHKLVRLSRTVPDRVLDLNYTGSVQAPASEPASHTLTLEYPGNATIGFGWTSTSPAEASRARLDVFAGSSASGTPIATSNGEPLTLRLAKGTYLLRVTNEQALLVDYTVRVRAVLEVVPDFGARAGDGHDHAH